MDVKKIEEYLKSDFYIQKAKQKLEFVEETSYNVLSRMLYWQKCAKSLPFFAERCLMLYEPRLVKYPEILFIPFDYQIEIWQKMDNLLMLGGDFFIEKSRDMGVSWAITAWLFHKWLFSPTPFSALVGSRKEEEVDSKNYNSIFGKLRFFLMTIPTWMRPKGLKLRQHVSHMRLINPETGSIIEGESSNPNWSRGRRVAIAVLDECFFWPHSHDAIQAVYDSAYGRVFISTPVYDSFAKNFVESLRKQEKVLTLKWNKNPFKTQEWYEEELKKREGIETSILHEIELSYDLPTEEQYYPESNLCQIKELEYDPKLPIYIGLDTGVYRDYTVLIWAQFDSKELKILEALITHGRIMDNKPLIEWFLSFFSKKIPLPDKKWYTDKEWEILQKVRSWEEPYWLCGESDLKAKGKGFGKSWSDILIETFRKYKVQIQINYNESYLSFERRRQAVSLFIKNTSFNSNSNGAINVLNALKATKKSISKTQNKVIPINFPGDKDARAAFENLCCSLETFTYSFRVINYV